MIDLSLSVNEKDLEKGNKNTDTGLIDCDIHPHVPSLQVLAPYLDEAWQHRIGIRGDGSQIKDRNIPAEQFEVPKTRYQHTNGILRKDAYPPNGGPPASDPEFLIKHWLEPFNIKNAILLG